MPPPKDPSCRINSCLPDFDSSALLGTTLGTKSRLKSEKKWRSSWESQPNLAWTIGIKQLTRVFQRGWSWCRVYRVPHAKDKASVHGPGWLDDRYWGIANDEQTRSQNWRVVRWLGLGSRYAKPERFRDRDLSGSTNWLWGCRSFLGMRCGR